MNEMTRHELEERLLDYLYDELEPSERSAFERALPAHPEVAREVEAHRATRKAYQALPRASAPAGMLDAVLAEADQEAARRRAPVIAEAAAPARARVVEDKLPFWERVRRFLFQPTFAMAMVVLVVAGVSLVATRKDDLPGMPTASDAQSLPTPPPVTVARSEPAMAPALKEERDRASALEASGALAAAEAPKVALDPAPPPAETTPSKDLARERGGESDEARKGQGGVKQLGNEGGAVGGSVAAFDSPSGQPTPTAPVPSKNDDVMLDGLAKTPDTKYDDGAGRRDGNVADETVRRPVETAPGELSKDFAPNGPAPRSGGTAPDGDLERPADKVPNEKGKAAPEKVAEDAETESPAPVDPARSKETKPATPAPADAPSPQREEVTRTNTDRVATIDDDKGERKKSEPTLTPPAPTPTAMWQAYQQQMAAGAYADAQRSIDQLAKLEGETNRVRDARAELSRRRAATPPTPPAANRVPPDPPVQPPK